MVTLECHVVKFQEPEEDSPETLAGHGAAVRFSSLGLLAPLHALLLTLQLVVKPDWPAKNTLYFAEYSEICHLCQCFSHSWYFLCTIIFLTWYQKCLKLLWCEFFNVHVHSNICQGLVCTLVALPFALQISGQAAQGFSVFGEFSCCPGEFLVFFLRFIYGITVVIA